MPFAGRQASERVASPAPKSFVPALFGWYFFAAGGVATDWSGAQPEGESSLLAAGDPRLAESARALLNG